MHALVRGLTCTHIFTQAFILKAGHFTSHRHQQITPLLAEIMLKVQQHHYFTRPLSREEKTAKGQRSFFNLEERQVIMNGIICPVWNMPKSTRGTTRMTSFHVGGLRAQTEVSRVKMCIFRHMHACMECAYLHTCICVHGICVNVSVCVHSSS